MTDTSYYDKGPRHSGFGQNSDGSVFNDPVEAAWSALKGMPGLKQQFAAMDFVTQAGPAALSLFDGENTFDELFTIFDQALNLAVNAIEAIEMIKMGATGTDPVDFLGFILSTMTTAGLTFAIEAFQPLEDVVGLVTGNADRIRVSKDMWAYLVEGLVPVAESLKSGAADLGTAWEDDGSTSARLRLLEGADIVTYAASVAKGLSGALEFCAATFDLVESYLIARLTDLAYGIGPIIADFLTGKVANAVADLILMVSKIVLELTRIGLNMARAFGALVGIMNGVNDAMGRIAPYLDTMSGECGR
ncbi:hypothetical protein [Salininema proteolyticum]|uniref:Uncharacterized protein n=1 Tax=Salininema proteolyticum TaxID=1607685 RepID=A0ABV8U451_9ACTN